MVGIIDFIAVKNHGISIKDLTVKNKHIFLMHEINISKYQ